MKHIPKRKYLFSWLRARRNLLLLVAILFGCFFVVYGLYGYGEWGVAGYAALLGLAAGAVFALVDLGRYTTKAHALAQVAGRFPTAPLPEAHSLPEAGYQAIIEALEAERARLEAESEHARRDAEEYYTLWAHQIKTPIAAMRLLLQADAGGPGRADIEQELFRIEQYVGMVLQYQRLSSLQSDLVLERFSLEELAKKAAKSCAPLFIHKKLPLSIEEVAGSIVTDQKWFCFVLEQLYTNAVKYTESGGIRVYSQGDVLVVEDSGIGIPAEDVPRVFERGFTGAAGRSERSSTGIGLYLCRQVLGRLGFGISIESAPGAGTRVLLHLTQAELVVE